MKTPKQQAKPGRKPNPKHQQTGPDLVSKTPEVLVAQEAAARQEQAAQGQHLALIDEQFGDNLPYDPVRLENEIRFFLQESATAMLEAGKRLVVLKEREVGSFHSSLQRIGIEPRAARKLMQAAIKFGGERGPALASLGRTKMLELMLEEDEDLDALAAGGTIRGLTLDEIERMSSRELKAALRTSRAEIKDGEAVTEKLLASKDDKINSLERELTARVRRVAKWEGAYKEIAGNLYTLTGMVLEGLVGLRAQVAAIIKEATDKNLSDAEVTSIVTPFYEHLGTMEEHFDDTRAHLDLNLKGYLPILNGADLRAQQERLATGNDVLADAKESWLNAAREKLNGVQAD